MSPEPSHYIHHSTISRLAGPVLCLSVSDDGKMASGGGGGTRLWRLPTGRKIANPSEAGLRGATTSMVWIKRDDEPDDVLFYGTQGGVLVGWKEVKQDDEEVTFEEVVCAQLAGQSEITGISFESTSNRLAVCSRSSIVQLFHLSTTFRLLNVFSVVVNDHVPKGIAFERAGQVQAIMTFGLYDGKIHTIKADTGAIEKTVETGGMIGNAQLDVQRNILCIDDPSTGAALYKSDRSTRVRSYKVPSEKGMRPRQVAFGEDCSRIVIGSDHGKVYIFDRRRGNIVEELFVNSSIWLQTVTTAEIMGIPYIIAAKSHDDGRNGEIYIWKKSTTAPPHSTSVSPGKHWKSWILHLAMVITSLAFVFQNLGVLRWMHSFHQEDIKSVHWLPKDLIRSFLSSFLNEDHRNAVRSSPIVDEGASAVYRLVSHVEADETGLFDQLSGSLGDEQLVSLAFSEGRVNAIHQSNDVIYLP